MTKMQFLMALHDALSGLPRDEIEERLNFYTEMIEDRIEEGLSEEQAVAAVGSVEEIASQIAREIPVSKAKEKTKIKPLEIEHNVFNTESKSGFDFNEALHPTMELSEIMKAFDLGNKEN